MQATGTRVGNHILAQRLYIDCGRKSHRGQRQLTDNVSLIFSFVINLRQDLLQRTIDIFFTVYPQEVAKFNQNATRTVYFDFAANISGAVAYATHTAQATMFNMVMFNVACFNANYKPDFDFDVVTHELMHVASNYKGTCLSTSSWLAEGLAEYARYLFGVN
jgi:hypothetical protein